MKRNQATKTAIAAIVIPHKLFASMWSTKIRQLSFDFI